MTSCGERQHQQSAYLFSVHTAPAQPADEHWHPSFSYCIKTSMPQTQGIIKPWAKIGGPTVACPFRLLNGIFHFEEGCGNTGEANSLNRALCF